MDNNPNAENKAVTGNDSDPGNIPEKTENKTDTAPLKQEPAERTDYISDDFDPAEIDLKQPAVPAPKTTGVPPAAHSEPAAAAPVISSGKKPAEKTGNLSSSRRNLSKRTPRYFNNGEPASIAAKSIFRQLLVLLIVVISVIALLIARSMIIGIVTDDGIFSLTMNSAYKETAAVEGVKEFKPKASSGYAAAQAVSVLTKDKITEDKLLESNNNKDVSSLNSGMRKILEESFPHSNITVRKNLSNYTLLTEIYDNLSEGNGIIVPMSLPKKELISGVDEITYAIVTSANYSTDQITLVTSYGDTRIISAEDFIKASRFDNYTEKSPKLSIEFLAGLKTINTAYFIDNKDPAK